MKYQHLKFQASSFLPAGDMGGEIKMLFARHLHKVYVSHDITLNTLNLPSFVSVAQSPSRFRIRSVVAVLFPSSRNLDNAWMILEVNRTSKSTLI